MSRLQNKTISQFQVGINESLIINLEMICEKSPKCSNNKKHTSVVFVTAMPVNLERNVNVTPLQITTSKILNLVDAIIHPWLIAQLEENVSAACVTTFLLQMNNRYVRLSVLNRNLITICIVIIL